jgi:hypothetical protein
VLEHFEATAGVRQKFAHGDRLAPVVTEKLVYGGEVGL